MWTEREIRDLIAIEVSAGQTMAVLNAAITSGELHTAVSQIATASHSGFEAQTARVTLMATDMEATKATIAAEMETTQAAIEEILQDCRTFVSQFKGQARRTPRRRR